MALYRRTINTVGGPGQSIPDYGAQEALAARSLQAQIAQSQQAQRNYMQEASFKRRESSRNRRDRQIALLKAETAAAAELKYKKDALERQEGYQEEERAERRKVAEHRRLIELQGKSSQAKDNIPTTPAMRKKYPELGTEVPMNVFISVSRQMEKTEGDLEKTKTGHEEAIKDKVAVFVQKQLTAIADAPSSELVWKDSDLLKLNNLIVGLKSKYEGTPEIDVPSLVKGEMDRQIKQYNQISVQPKLKRKANPDFRGGVGGGFAEQPDFMEFQRQYSRPDVSTEDWRTYHTMLLQEKLNKAPEQLRKHILESLEVQYP